MSNKTGILFLNSLKVWIKLWKALVKYNLKDAKINGALLLLEIYSGFIKPKILDFSVAENRKLYIYQASIELACTFGI